MKIRYTFILFILLLFTNATHISGINSNWGLKQGDTIIYWIDEVQFSEIGDVNLAALFSDANRTIIVIIENVTSTSIDYVIGFMNGSDVANSFTEEMTSIDIGQGNTLILPNGGFPIAIPLSVENINNYSEYLMTTNNVLDSFVMNLVTSDSEFSGNLTINSFIDQSLVINASIELPSNNNFTAENTGLLNTNYSQLFEMSNYTLENTWVGIEVGYNLTDGAMDYLTFRFHSIINSTEQASNSVISGALNIYRLEKYSIEEIIKKAKEAPVVGWETALIITAIIGYRKRRNII